MISYALIVAILSGIIINFTSCNENERIGYRPRHQYRDVTGKTYKQHDVTSGIYQQTTPTCFETLQRVNLRRIRSHAVFNITGLWVSARCEVRPGPEFLLRSYLFQANGSFNIYQHFYQDHQCSRPTYSVLATGRVILNSAHPVRNIPSATKTKYEMENVDIYVHDGNYELEKRICDEIPESCKRKRNSNIFSARIFSHKKKKNNLYVINFSLNELKLMVIEESLDERSATPIKSLYLGDIHTKSSRRSRHHPVTFQTPLLNSKYYDPRCYVCSVIIKSSHRHPPALPQQRDPEFNLSGYWASIRCEKRQDKFYQTRKFHFEPKNSSWSGIYYYYKNPQCTQMVMKLKGEGRYTVGEKSLTVDGAMEYIFRVENLSVLPQNKFALRRLKRDRVCGSTYNWKIGIDQNVTITNGCLALGIVLPHVEYELLRIERDSITKELQLLTGQRPSDGVIPNSVSTRATSYQDELVKCSEVNFTPSRNIFYTKKVPYRRNYTQQVTYRNPHYPTGGYRIYRDRTKNCNDGNSSLKLTVNSITLQFLSFICILKFVLYS